MSDYAKKSKDSSSLVVYEEAKRWKSGLCYCCGTGNDDEEEEEDDEECLCVVGACVCPCVGYAWNYAVAVQQEDSCYTWLLPCCVHFALDGAVSWVAAHFSGIPYLMLPVGTVLRVLQRRVVEKEDVATTCVEELVCWGCSIGEVNRKLREREREHLPPYGVGNSVLGTLSEPPCVVNGQNAPDWEL